MRRVTVCRTGTRRVMRTETSEVNKKRKLSRNTVVLLVFRSIKLGEPKIEKEHRFLRRFAATKELADLGSR
jgi:hypothetical protein